MKNLHFWVKIVFWGEIPFFLESFGLELLVPFDTFVAEHVELIEIGLRLPVLFMK